MITVGSIVIALHGSRGYVRGEITRIEGDQVKLIAKHYADRDYNWRKAAPHEQRASALLSFCKLAP